MAVLELGLADRIPFVETTLRDPASTLLPHNPVGRVSSLVLADGTTVTETTPILMVLDSLVPPEAWSAAAVVGGYIGSAFAVAGMVGVARWGARWAGYVPGLRWVPGLLTRTPGQQLSPGQVDAVRGLATALAVVGALRDSVVPLGPGLWGQVGAGCLVALLSMGAAEGIKAATRRLRS
jgi:hypothetical protein